ncbi:MAG: hypothetical protein R3316_03860 [Rhodovibrionaceae bacterium]|nr:hypothetical protein [Rhodovibrionaceae bacterium]
MREPFRKGHAAALTALAAATLVVSGCVEVGPGGVEAKIGAGPFKAYSWEAGPGGVEEKGPSAGPFKTTKGEDD